MLPYWRITNRKEYLKPSAQNVTSAAATELSQACGVATQPAVWMEAIYPQCAMSRSSIGVATGQWRLRTETREASISLSADSVGSCRLSF